MANFKYRAVDSAGKIVNGRIDAGSQEEVEQTIARQGLELIDAKEAGDSIISKLLPKKGITRDELAQFCFYTERLVAGGVPLLEGLSDVRDSVTNPTMRNVIGNVIQDIENGSSLSDALRRHPKQFDAVFVSLIEAGEQSGELDSVLNSLAESIKWQDEVIKKTKKMLQYPIVAFIVIAVATGMLMYLVVPPMTTVLKALGSGDLPIYTEALIGLSDFVVGQWHVMIISVFALWFGIVFAVKTIPNADYYIDRTTIRLPIFGDVSQKLLMSRFTSVFGLLYGAGVSVVDGLNIAKGSLGNKFVAQGLDDVINKIANGTSLSDSFRESGLFPPLVLRMIRLGEATGGVDQAMLQVKNYYDRDTNEAIETAQSIIPSVTMFFLAGLLIWVVVAIYGPLYDAISKVS